MFLCKLQDQKTWGNPPNIGGIQRKHIKHHLWKFTAGKIPNNEGFYSLEFYYRTKWWAVRLCQQAMFDDTGGIIIISSDLLSRPKNDSCKHIPQYSDIWAISKTLGSRKGHPQIWEGPIAYIFSIARGFAVAHIFPAWDNRSIPALFPALFPNYIPLVSERSVQQIPCRDGFPLPERAIKLYPYSMNKKP